MWFASTTVADEGGAPSSVRRALTTVLFTDIAGSTVLAGQLGDAGWRELLEKHNRLVREQLGRFGGQVVGLAAGEGGVWVLTTE